MKQIFIFVLLYSTGAWAAPIEFRLDADSGTGRIYTNCTFDGHSESCFFDSGSDSSMITNSKFSEPYPSRGKRLYGGASGKPVECDIILFNNFEAADLSLSIAEVPRWPIDSKGESVLGINAFQGKTLRLNSSARTLDGVNDPIPLNIQKNRFIFSPGGLVTIAVALGQAKTQAVWDTGAGLTSVDSSFVKKNRKLFQFLKNEEVTDANGNVIVLKRYLMKKIEFGGKSFKDVDVYAFDFGPVRHGIGDKTDIILGFNVITKIDWYINLRTREWALTQ